MLKKSISTILVVVILFSIFSAFSITTNAEIEPSNLIFDYTVNDDGTACITGCYGVNSNFNLIIPSNIEGHIVTSIGSDAFKNNKWILSVALPDTVTHIGKRSFFCCENLHQVSLGNGLEIIDEYSFQGCKELKEIDLPESLTTVGDGAFISGVSFTSLRIPKNVINIGVCSFPSYSLERIAVDEDNPVFDSRNDCNAIIVTNSNTLICGSNNTIIPDTVTSIGACAFECCEFQSISLPESVVFIDRNAFLACFNLRCISMPNVSRIHGSAFQCTGIYHVSLPKIRYIATDAFSGCIYLHSVYFGKTLSHLDSRIFGTGIIYGHEDLGGKTPLSDVYYEGSEEEWGKVRFDEMINAKLHFNCSESDYNNLYFTVLGENFEQNLQWYAENWDSTKYNPELAHLMMTMSNAAYNQKNVEKAYEELGLTNYDYNFYDEIFADYGTEKAPFSVGHVKDDDGTICVLVSIKGSGDIRDVTQGFLDWMGNISLKNIKEDGMIVNENFYNTMRNIYDQLDTYLYAQFNRHIEDMTGIKYFVTGHSRGAAVGNLLEIELGKIVGKKSVYGYNYAVPDYVIAKRTHNLSIGYENIFNLSHIQDEVSYLPGYIVDAQWSFYEEWINNEENSYCKLGNTVWFDDGQLDEIGIDAHVDGQKYYINYLRNRYSISNYTDNPKIHLDYWKSLFSFGYGYKYYATFCPVDVELIDQNGKVIASVINNVADYHDSHFGDVIITTDGDHKLFAVPANSNYTLRIVGNDNGTMDYFVKEVNLANGKVNSANTFKDVALENGKEMVGKAVNVIDSEEQMIQEDKLITVGDEPMEILTDGEEVPYTFSYILGDADDSGEVEAIDATWLQRYIASFATPYDFDTLMHGDVDYDGEADITDVTMIQRYLAQFSTPYLIGVDVIL